MKTAEQLKTLLDDINSVFENAGANDEATRMGIFMSLFIKDALLKKVTKGTAIAIVSDAYDDAVRVIEEDKL